MNIRDAEEIYERYSSRNVLSEDEEFLYIEALEYLIYETKNTKWMVSLGGYYYEKEIYDLALKYYEMADSHGDHWAPMGLGYIWYYGRTGEPDYEKAFRYYSVAAERGYLQAEVKVADMYKNGYGVGKDYEKYCRIIENAYETVKDTKWLGEPLPEVFTRLAKIREKQGDLQEAANLYLSAKNFLSQRIQYDPFFGNLNIMKWLVNDLYALIPVDYSDLDLFDLYYVLKEPCTVVFYFQGKRYEVSSEKAEDDIVIQFEDKWYRTIDDFFAGALIGRERLPVLNRRLYNFEVTDHGTD